MKRLYRENSGRAESAKRISSTLPRYSIGTTPERANQRKSASEAATNVASITVTAHGVTIGTASPALGPRIGGARAPAQATTIARATAAVGTIVAAGSSGSGWAPIPN